MTVSQQLAHSHRRCIRKRYSSLFSMLFLASTSLHSLLAATLGPLLLAAGNGALAGMSLMPVSGERMEWISTRYKRGKYLSFSAISVRSFENGRSACGTGSKDSISA